MANVTPFTVTVTDGNGNPQQMGDMPPYLAPVQINASGGFPLTLMAATPGSLCRLYRLFIVVDGATTLTFMDGATTLYPQFKVEQPGEVIELDPQLFPWFQGSLDTAFELNSSNAVQITGAAWLNLNPV